MPETLVVQADIAELARVSEWTEDVAQRLALPSSVLFALHLCFEEAVSNIIRHGYRGSEAAHPEVSLALAREADTLTATIEDHGAPFDPSEVATPAAPDSLEDAAIGGLGVHLMRQFTQDMTYRRQDDTNRLTLRFALT